MGENSEIDEVMFIRSEKRIKIVRRKCKKYMKKAKILTLPIGKCDATLALKMEKERKE